MCHEDDSQELSWRTNKSNLVRKYLNQGLEPFDEKHPYIEQDDWNDFVQLRKSVEAQAASQRFK